MNHSPVNKIGFWSSTLSVFFALGYSFPQILSTLKIIPHPQDLFWLFLPSLFLAPAFLVAMLCLDFSVSGELKIWTKIGVAFAIIYCTLVTIVYFSQLTIVLPGELKRELDPASPFLFESKTFLMAVDCLGYFFMSFSTFFAAFAFSKNKKQKWLYRVLLWNGALMPVLVLAFFYPPFYYAGAVWMITFPLAMINAARFFKNDSQTTLKINIAYETK